MDERLDQGGFATAVIKNRCRVPKFFFPMSLNGKGLEFIDLSSALAALPKPKFATPPKTPPKCGSIEKKVLRGGKKKPPVDYE